MANPNECLKEIESAISCAICLDVFKSPRILPECGHTYCADCLGRLTQWSQDRQKLFLKCPECRSPNFFELGGLKANVHAQHVADIVRGRQKAESVAKKAMNETNLRFCSHVSQGSPAQVPTVQCKHCSSQLCLACLYQHMEEIRIATVTSASKFSSRLEQACKTFKSRHKNMTSLIDESVSTTEDSIRSHFQKLEQTVITGLGVSKERLLNRVRQLGSARKRKLDEIHLEAKDPLANAAMAKRVSKVVSESILQCSLDYILQLQTDISEQNSRISRLESVLEAAEANAVFDLKFEADTNGVESDLLKILKSTENNAVQLVPFEPKVKPWTDVTQQVHCAAILGDVGCLKAILQDENLPLLAKSYLVGHKDRQNDATPLLQASANGHADVVAFLVSDCEACLTTCDNKGFLPFHHAVMRGHAEIVQLLLETKPDLMEATTGDQKTAVDLAKECQFFDRLKPIFDKALK